MLILYMKRIVNEQMCKQGSKKCIVFCVQHMYTISADKGNKKENLSNPLIFSEIYIIISKLYMWGNP